MGFLGRQAGHTMAEYAVIIAGIAVVCVVAALFVGATIRGRLDAGGSGIVTAPTPVLTPPSTQAPASPVSLEECVRDGWRTFPQFHSERECKDYVRSLGR
jgi:Flp pilus assembly pilin Flp